MAAVPARGFELCHQGLQLGQLVVADLAAFGHPGHERRHRAAQGLFHELAHGVACCLAGAGGGGAAAVHALRLAALEVTLGAQPLHHGEHGGAGQAVDLAEARRDLAHAGGLLFGEVAQQGKFLVADGRTGHGDSSV